MDLKQVRTYREALMAFKKEYWTALMEECGHSIPAVVAISQMNRSWVYRILKELNIKVNEVNRGSWQNFVEG